MRRILLGLWLLTTVHCETQELPGSRVGMYQVTGNLEDNSCGQTALPARDPLEFGVEIRQQGQIGYWVVTPPGTPGELSQDGDFRFHRQTTHPAISPNSGSARQESWQDYAGGAVVEAASSSTGCTLIVEELVRGQLAPDEDAGPPRILAGINEITIRPEAGSDCRPALATAGGPFLALPCVARYALSGSAE